MEWSLSGTLCQHQAVREAGKARRRRGGEGREAWSIGQAQGKESEGTPFLEVREEHLEFKAEGAMPS